MQQSQLAAALLGHPNAGSSSNAADDEFKDEPGEEEGDDVDEFIDEVYCIH